MPVEKTQSLRAITLKQKGWEVTDEDKINRRLAFATAIGAGTPKATVLREIEIAGSTYYKWRDHFLKYGDRWIDGEQLTRAKCFPATTARTTRREIVEASLQYPAWSAKDIAEQLFTDRGIRVSRSTINNYLKAAGVNTRALRAAVLHSRWLKKLSLTPEQERLVETIDRHVRWKGPKGKAPREVLAHDVVRVHHTRVIGGASINIIVDTFDGSAFARFAGSPAACMNEAVEAALANGQRVLEICTDNGYEFGKRNRKHPYKILLNSYGIFHTLVKSPDNRRNPLAEEVLADIEKFLFDGGLPDPANYRNRLEKLNPLVQNYLEKIYGRF